MGVKLHSQPGCCHVPCGSRFFPWSAFCQRCHKHLSDLDAEPDGGADEEIAAVLAHLVMTAPWFSLRGGAREILRGMITRPRPAVRLAAYFSCGPRISFRAASTRLHVLACSLSPCCSRPDAFCAASATALGPCASNSCRA